jgi:PAS domain S-box-containing protein
MSILKVRDSWQGLAIIRDITDRKKNENEILLQKERLRATLTTSPDAIVIVDVQGNVVECNEATLKLFQYASIEEVLGKNSLKFIAPREHSRVLGELNQVMANRGQFGSQQFVARKKNGEEFLMEAAGSALRDHSGKILWAVLNLSDLTERKKTETEIKLQQERWQATLASSPDSIILTDMKSKIVDCNAATLKRLQYKSKAEVIGKNSIEFVKESSDQPEEFIRRALEQKGPITTDEFIGVKSDGEQFIGEASANILRDQSGHPLGLVVVTRDITERKKAEAALRNSEEQFRSLAENSPNMIFINQNGRIVYVNKESENTMGYTKEEYYAPDFNFMRLIAPEFKELVKTNFGKHLANQEIGPYESRLVTKKGQVKDVIINSRIIQYNGEPALLGIATDITERKKAELEAADAKEKFMVYVESSPVAIFVANPQGKYEYTNEAASKLLGYSREELLHMSIPQLSFEQDLPMALKKFAEVNETGRSLSEMTLKTKQGLPVYVILNAIKLPDGNLLAFCENVTERKKAEKEILIQTERVKATFSASPDAIISLDLKGNVSDCNEEALKLFHYPSKERLIGKNSLQLIKEADRQQASSDLQGVLQYNKAIRNREYIGLKANEEDVLLEVSVSILKDDSGHTAGLIATAKDITERKKTEEKIRLLSSVVEQTVEGIAVSDLKGQILFVNSAWLKMHNYNIHDQSLIGQEVMKFYCLPQIEAVEKIIGTESVFRGRMTHVRKDGTTFQTIATLSPLRNEEGKIIGIIHMAKNLTDIVRDIRDTRQISTCNGEKPAVAAV